MLERRTLVIDDLSKGLNTFAPETRVPDGFYVDAQNMYYGTSKNPQTVLGLTPLTTTGVPSGNIVWVEPYTTTAGVTTYLVYYYWETLPLYSQYRYLAPGVKWIRHNGDRAAVVACSIQRGYLAHERNR